MRKQLSQFPDQTVYQLIVKEYLENGSILKTVKKTGSSEVTVRRVLITEGLWSSKTSRKVDELRQRGMSVSEIAKELSVTEKAVEAYLPYRKGMYGERQTDAAQYSREYRERNALTQEKMLGKEPDVSPELRYKELVKKECDQLRDNTEDLWKRLRPDERSVRNYTGRELLKEVLCITDVDLEEAGVLFDQVKDSVNEEALGLPDYSEKVYRLHIELEASGLDMVDSYRQEDAAHINRMMLVLFRRYAKATNGISRDILVPGNMTLHALHYAIMKLFGFLGYHLHHFELTDEDFNRVTAARVGGYKDLCGVLFRFPDIFESDASWDDDYDGKGSIRNWYKKKYSAPFHRAGVGDTWYVNARELEEFSAEYPDITDDMLVEDLRDKWLFEQDLNRLVEDLTVQELFTLPSCSDDEEKDKKRFHQEANNLDSDISVWKAEVLGKKLLVDTVFSNMLREGESDYLSTLNESERRNVTDITEGQKKQMDELCKRLDRVRDSYGTLQWYLHYEPERIKKDIEADGSTVEEQIRNHEEEIKLLTSLLDFLFDDYNVHPEPLFQEIQYRYDYGDNWKFRIRVQEVYTRMEYLYENDERIESDLLPQKEALEKYRYTDSRGTEPYEELRQKLAQVDVKGRPVCIEADGLNLVEDVGGIHGLYQFYQSVNGEILSPEQREERSANLEWARGLGWTGRKSKAENML